MTTSSPLPSRAASPFSSAPLLAHRPGTPTSPATPTPLLPVGGRERPATPLSPPLRPIHTAMSRSPVHPGCVVCGIVASAASTMPATEAAAPQAGPSTQPSAPQRPGSTLVGARDVVYHDADVTAYPAQGKERLSERHIIIALNQHAESVYELGPSDIPLLSHVLAIGQRLLLSAPSSDSERGVTERDIRVGFVGSLMRDPASPHAHLHAHAYVAPLNSKYASFWRRNFVYTAANWWSIDDLRAEIRESTSNNRVKSGYAERSAPIDRVPDAGASVGLPNALEADPYSDAPSPSPVRLELPPHGKGKARREHGSVPSITSSAASARTSASTERGEAAARSARGSAEEPSGEDGAEYVAVELGTS